MEISVGALMLAGIIALLVLAFQVSGLTMNTSGKHYNVTAAFDNVGGLKIRAPVTIAGVKIGQVTAIHLDPVTFKATVTLQLDDDQSEIPVDSSASILTEGLLGSNYVSLNPGYAETYLKNGSTIVNTQPAIILENLIGQLMFRLGNSNK